MNRNGEPLMKWLIKHNGLVAREMEATDNRQQAPEQALDRLGYSLTIADGPVPDRERFIPWRCDDGTYDFVDHSGDIIYTNLGNGTDEESAWAHLARILRA